MNMSNVTGVSRKDNRGTLLLSRGHVARLLGMDECIAAVEQAFRMHGEGRVAAPGLLEIPAGEGVFHIKAGVLGRYFAAKSNANFPGNRERGLPSIQGVIILGDTQTGYPLAVMDAREITMLRTAAASAVAAKLLAREDAGSAAVCGCGVQGRAQLRALSRVRSLRRAAVWDIDAEPARRFAAEMAAELGIEVRVAADPAAAARGADLIVTCTPSRKFYLRQEDVAAGAFIAAVGADSEGKQELDPRLLAGSKVVADIHAQCAAIGELQHAADKTAHAELGEVVAGKRPARTSPGEIIIFDSTGTALQDAAAAAAVYEKALAAGAGTIMDFSEDS